MQRLQLRILLINYLHLKLNRKLDCQRLQQRFQPVQPINQDFLKLFVNLRVPPCFKSFTPASLICACSASVSWRPMALTIDFASLFLCFRPSSAYSFFFFAGCMYLDANCARASFAPLLALKKPNTVPRTFAFSATKAFAFPRVSKVFARAPPTSGMFFVRFFKCILQWRTPHRENVTT